MRIVVRLERGRREKLTRKRAAAAGVGARVEIVMIDGMR